MPEFPECFFIFSAIVSGIHNRCPLIADPEFWVIQSVIPSRFGRAQTPGAGRCLIPEVRVAANAARIESGDRAFVGVFNCLVRFEDLEGIGIDVPVA
jgi:hypothetical protein